MSITLLPVRLRLVSVPKQSLPLLTHPVIRNIFFEKGAARYPSSARPRFFNITENQLEITIVLDMDSASNDFAPLLPFCPGMIICESVFTALQVDDVYGMEYSGQRIHELSAALADAGISILYISTYQTDFILVKEKRIPLVIATLEQAHFLVSHPDPPFDRCPPPPLVIPTMAATPSSSTSHGPIDISPRDCHPDRWHDRLLRSDGLASSWGSMSSSPMLPMMREDSEDGGPFLGMEDEATGLVTGGNNGERVAIWEVRRNVRKSVPENDLRLVGLNRDYIDVWSISLLQALFYPETSQYVDESPPPRLNPVQSLNSTRFISFTQFEDGVSLICDAALLRGFPEHAVNTFVKPVIIRCIQMDLTQYGLDKYGVVYSVSDPLVAQGINLLYLSTYRTANVLIKAEDLQPSLAILNALKPEHQRIAVAVEARTADDKRPEAAPEGIGRRAILTEKSRG